MGRTYKFYISGGMNFKLLELVLHTLPVEFGAGLITQVRNPGRGGSEATFLIDIPTQIPDTTETYDNLAMTIREWIIENVILFEDVTPPE